VIAEVTGDAVVSKGSLQLTVLLAPPEDEEDEEDEEEDPAELPPITYVVD
jgi:hypothetical protein